MGEASGVKLGFGVPSDGAGAVAAAALGARATLSLGSISFLSATRAFLAGGGGGGMSLGREVPPGLAEDGNPLLASSTSWFSGFLGRKFKRSGANLAITSAIEGSVRTCWMWDKDLTKSSSLL